jgi:hypothetical protein
VSCQSSLHLDNCAALLVLHAPMFAPVVQLTGLAAALGAAGWHAWLQDWTRDAAQAA